ncbi:MAG: hypothetical protein NVS4B11_06260 [Ktedonobacteraceae bacterium]
MVKTSEKSHVVRLQLTCATSPQRPCDTTEVEFGLQDRHQVVHPGQLQPDGSLLYEFDVAVIHQSETHEVRLRGSYVHGTPAAPFLYLSWKRLSPDPAPWLRRLKVPLPSFAWEQVEVAQATPCFAASVSGDGSGTVPLLGEGWIRQDHPSVM